MLYKYMHAEKRARQIAEKIQRCSVPTMKYTNLSSSVSTKFTKKIIRSATKKSIEHFRKSDDSDPSELSSDSGLGLDHQIEVQLATRSTLPFSINNKLWYGDETDSKRKRYNYQFDLDDINDDFCFPKIGAKSETLRAKSESEVGFYHKDKTTNMPGRGRGISSTPVTLSTPLSSNSRDGKTQLLIVCQPEQQHRARYQTEGSRGAVKDRTGNGFPVVKLGGYNKPTTLQIFIGTDIGRVMPHMFYQACRVSGKNSTPCIERKIDGTVVIEVDLDPSKDMVITCDCVGILKERNVDVEHRFPNQTGTRNKKKSTRCRMVFRTSITNSDGSTEVLQVCSQPIVCTQPPGVPEICKKSLTSCPATGGAELFILGKNFLKDTKVIFQLTDIHPPWEETVLPDKEFLQQTHLICVVPPYRNVDIIDPVTVKIFVTSSGKNSDPHTFIYLPAGSPIVPSVVDSSPCSSYLHSPLSQAFVNGNRVFAKASNIPPILPSSAPLMKPPTMKPSYFDAIKKDVHSIPMMWPPPTKPEATEEEDKMMPPPPALIPISRRPSVPLMLTDAEAELKTEMIDDVGQQCVVEHDQNSLSPTDVQGVDLSMKTPLLRHLVDIPPVTIGSLGVDKYFSKGSAPKSSYTVYDSEQQRQFLEEDLLRPPPAKIPSLEFSVNSDMVAFPRNQSVSTSTVIHPAVHSVNESSQSGFETNSSGRSESFSENASITENSSINENSVNSFDTYPRVRISNMSQIYDHSTNYESRSTVLRVYDSEPSPMVLSNDCSIDNAMSSVVKQAVREMESAFYCQASTPATSSLTQVTSNSSNLNSLVCQELIATTPQTRSLDEFVNCAAVHMSPKNEPFVPNNSSITSQSTPVESSPTNDSYNLRFQINSHNLLSSSSDTATSTMASKEVSVCSPGKSIIESRPDTFDKLATSITNQILSKSEKIEDASSTSTSLKPLIAVNSSPVTQASAPSFSISTTEAKPLRMPSPNSQTKSQVLSQAKDIPFSTKIESELEDSSRLKSSSIPLTVRDISDGAQKIGDMIVPAGPAPPITGMVPQEMVKMTDNDLISYINPSCFDQGAKENWSASVSSLFF